MLAKIVDVIAWFDLNGEITPLKIKVDENNSNEVIKINSIISKDYEKLADINDKFGKHCDTVIYKHISGNRQNYLDESQMKFIDENIGIMKQKDIADKLGISPGTITYYKNHKENY